MTKKLIEILYRDNARFALTVTPTRVTIKVQKETSHEDRTKVINFLKQVANQPEMVNCTMSFRGQIKLPTDHPLSIQLSNDSGKVTHSYNESNLV